MYLIAMIGAALPASAFLLSQQGSYSLDWVTLSFASLVVSTVSVRLPRTSSVISMGDAFTLIAFLEFGPGPALLTYCCGMLVAHITDQFSRFGSALLKYVLWHRLAFNLAGCALSVTAMHVTVSLLPSQITGSAIHLPIVLLVLAGSWFLINTTSVAFAVSLWRGKAFWEVWTDGLGICLLNFLGSAAAAGLLKLFYTRTGFYVFLLCLPLGAILYQLHRFYIEKYEQAQKHLADLNALYHKTIETMASAVDAKDAYTHGHVRRVQVYALTLARLLGVSDENLSAIRAGALLHDIGKIAVPEYVLNKPAALTEAEFAKMRVHPVIGACMLEPVGFPYPVVPAVRFHHERWDGLGYPDGLVAEEIPLPARVISIADCYDALTTNRPYRSPMTREMLTQFFRRESGRAYDPLIVKCLLSNVAVLEDAAREAAIPDVGPFAAVVLSDRAVANHMRRLDPEANYAAAVCPSTDRLLYALAAFACSDLRGVSPEEGASFAHERLSKVVLADAVVVYLVDASRGDLVAVAATRGSGLLDHRIAMEQKLTGWAVANRQTLANLGPFPDFTTCQDQTLRERFATCLITPMVIEDEAIGAVCWYRVEQQPFSEEECQIGAVAAAQAGLVVARSMETPYSEALLVDGLSQLPNRLGLDLIAKPLFLDADRLGSKALLVYVGASAGYSRREVFVGLREVVGDGALIGALGDGSLAALRTMRDATEVDLLVADLTAYLTGIGSDWGLALYPDDGREFGELVRRACSGAQRRGERGDSGMKSFPDRVRALSGRSP